MLGFTGHDRINRHDPNAKGTVGAHCCTSICISQWLIFWYYRTWASDVNVEALKESDPGLAIASSVPVHRLGAPEEVANVVAM